MNQVMALLAIFSYLTAFLSNFFSYARFFSQLFSVMPPKSDPPIVEASVEMSFVASLHSEVVVKFRCEEEEVLGKTEIFIDHRSFQ